MTFQELFFCIGQEVCGNLILDMYKYNASGRKYLESEVSKLSKELINKLINEILDTNLQPQSLANVYGYCQYFIEDRTDNDDIKMIVKVLKRENKDKEKQFFEYILTKSGSTIKQLSQAFAQIERDDCVDLISKYTDDCYVRYERHFKIPCFLFLRDTLSYMFLLLLHVAVCVQPTDQQLSVLEWFIMVFFIGRIALEIDQYISENDEMPDLDSNYENEFWNKLDIVCIIIYVAIFTSRVVTLSNTSFVVKKDSIVVASYLYGINAVLLTLRVFGQTMEVKQSTGTKQIALLRIIVSVLVVFIQLVAAIMAFSLILTKIYVAERSYVENTNSTHSICFTSDGILCLWHFFEYLAWSAVVPGDPDLLSLNSSVSNYISKTVYMLFLIVTAVMIMNMLIALLANTYQKVEDNAYNEWCYRKACIIKTYCNYHPVPVPYNIITLSIQLFRGLISKCKREKKEEKRKVVMVPQMKYFCDTLYEEYQAEFANSFPGQESKEVKLLKMNQRFIGQIASEVLNHQKKIKSSKSDEWESHTEQVMTAERGLLCHVKCTDCDKIQLQCVHSARYAKYLSKEGLVGFEVLIIHCGKQRNIGIGLASQSYDLYRMPGLRPGSIGYHVDHGTIHEGGGVCDIVDDALATIGDLIGCRVLFDQIDENDEHDTFPVQFTLNGRVLDERRVKKSINYPFVSSDCPGSELVVRFIRNTNTADRQDALSEQMSTITRRQDGPNEQMSKITDRQDGLSKQMSTITGRQDGLNEQMSKITGHLQVLSEQMSANNEVLQKLLQKDNR